MKSPNSKSTISTIFLTLIIAIACGTPSQATAQEPAQKNSTRKMRVSPNELSQKIGTAIRWQPDYDSAVAASQQTGKPIFWYVPTLNGTFMDRKPVIDRYMLAGPFSWPDIIAAINEHYIPVRTEPTQEQQQSLELVAYKFVEPGFLIIEPEGKVTSRVDRITTMHPNWFRHLITRSVLQALEPKQKSAAMATAWSQFSNRQYEDVINGLAAAEIADEEKCESELLRGMATFRQGQHAAAQKIWQSNSEAFPDHPLGWKSAAEAQGIGPFMRGFEVHGPLSEKAMTAGVDSIGSAAPLATYTDAELWNNGVNFLLDMQNEDGGFTDCDYDFGGFDSMPNVYVAVTSLAGMALVDASKQDEISPETKSRIAESITKAIAYVTNDKNVNQVDRDEILWAYAYRLRLISKCLQLPEGTFGLDKATLTAAHSKCVTALEDVQSRGGGWYHEYNNPFVTATALVALHEASQTGAKVDEAKIAMGLKSLLSDRMANGAFPYSSPRAPNGQQKPGTARDVSASAGRMPLCELSLFLWGKSTAEDLASAVERSLAFQDNLDVAYKYDNHTSRLAYGGFFFWYDMRARSETINHVADEQLHADFKTQHRALLLALPELDGCFVDSHELGRVYGTAMALMSLANTK